MLKTLLKKQMTETFRAYFYNAKQNKSRSKGATITFFALFFVLMAGLLGGLFTVLAVMLCEPLVTLELDWMYFIIMSLIAILLGAFGSVFNTYAGLYLARDNDLLLSMPIPVRYILTARLLGVYLMGLMYSIVVTLPAAIVYWVVAPFSVLSIVGGLLFILLISLIVLVLSCALGWVVAKISQKLKNKSFISVLASLTFLGIYYFVYYKAQSIINDLLANAILYGEKIRGNAYPLYLLGKVGEGDPLGMAVWTAGVALILALTLYIMAHGFIRMATSTGATARAVYREQKARVASPSRALFRRELKRFAASPTYMLNCAMGALFAVVAAVFLFVRCSWAHTQLLSLTEQLGVSMDVLLPLAGAMLCLLLSMVDITAPSVSLEGKTLWLSQSLPVTPQQVLTAKLQVHLLIGEPPALLCGVALICVLRPTVYEAILLLLVPLLSVLLSGCFGLFMDISHPNLTWTSEITPIKQGMSVMATLFGGWGYAALLGVGSFFLCKLVPGFVCLICECVLTGGLCLVLLGWLRGQGSRRFGDLRP